MSRFGIPQYGSPTLYGEPNQADFNARPVEVYATAQQYLSVQWRVPTGTISRIRVVRTIGSESIRVEDGVIVYDDVYNPAVYTYDDRNAPPGVWTCYTVFAYDTSADVWVNCGAGYGMAIPAGTWSQNLPRLLPGAMTTHNYAASSEPDPDHLMTKWMSALALMPDDIAVKAEALSKFHSAAECPPMNLTALADTFGIPAEHAVGTARLRQVLLHLGDIYQTKGTLTGLDLYATALTGYPITLRVGNNFMLDRDDSSGETGIGRWAVSSGTATITRDDYSVTPRPTLPTDMAGNGCIKVTLGATATTVLRCGASDPRSYGIPVEGWSYIKAGFFGRASVGSRTIALAVRWYSMDGTYLSTSATLATMSPSATTWTSNTGSEVAVAANAVWAVPEITITSGADTNVFHIDAIRIGRGAAEYVAWEDVDARAPVITLYPRRYNLVTNPSFETNATGWSEDAADQYTSTYGDLYE